MNAYTVIGISDEHSSCDCCARTNLKSTVVLQDSDGEFHFFGSACAARALGWSVQDVTSGARSAAKARRAERRDAVARHPLTLQVQREIDQANAAGRTPYAERRKLMQLWNELGQQVEREIAILFDF